jgi:predicted metal-dependent phosphoesterase TrpH
MSSRKTTRLDLHVHTRGSDGTGTPTMIAQAALAAGLDGLVITDHHHTFTPEGLAVADVCRAAGLIVLHGCEVSTDDGHCLVYGVDVDELDFPYYPPMQAVIDGVNEAGGVVLPSHPFKGYKRLLGDKVFDLEGISALEGANGQAAFQNPIWNKKAKAAAKKLGYSVTGGSDAHRPGCIGLCYTEFKGRVRTTKDLVEALKAGTFRAVVKRRRVSQEAERYSRLKVKLPTQPLFENTSSRIAPDPYDGWSGFPEGEPLGLDSEGLTGHSRDDESESKQYGTFAKIRNAILH